MIDTKNSYYISTGDHNGFYTLRHVYQDCVFFGDGQYRDIFRDQYCQNLSRDWKEAIRKAQERADECNARLMTTIDDEWQLNEWGSGKTGGANIQKYYIWKASIENNIMPFGKHAGQSLADIPGGYRNWVRAEGNTSPAWNLLVEAFKPYEAEDQKLIKAREAEIAKREVEKQNREHVASVKDRITKKITCVAEFPFESYYGDGMIRIFLDEDGNKYKTFGKSPIIKGEEATCTFTIKSHDEWKGEKQNTIIRIKLTD